MFHQHHRGLGDEETRCRRMRVVLVASANVAATSKRGWGWLGELLQQIARRLSKRIVSWDIFQEILGFVDPLLG